MTAGGAPGPYGFHEALDYTPRRLPEGASVAVVESYMAHHQGMSLVALGNVADRLAMVERFHADPIVQATELLLQERMPRDALVARPRAEEVKSHGRRARPRRRRSCAGSPRPTTRSRAPTCSRTAGTR